MLRENNVIDFNDSYNFWNRVDIKDNFKDCWNWTGYQTIWGYGSIKVNDKMMRSHRMAYMLSKGKIPNGLQVQHLCNNRLCCNPDHLVIGNHSKNIQYMYQCERREHIGEKGYNVILTEDNVRNIHRKYKEQKFYPGHERWRFIESIAKEFNVSIGCINNILYGYTWHHIYKELNL